MTLEFQNQKSDYIRFFKLYHLEQFWKRIYAVILLPLVLGFCSASTPFLWQRFFVAFGVFEALILAIYYVSFWVSVWKFNKLQLNDPRYLERKELSVGPEGLVIKYTNETTTIHWETMLSIKSYGRLLAVFLVDRRFLIIQINSFDSNEEYLNFIGLVQSRVNKGYLSPKLNAVEKPPYLLGLLCIIPIVGAFVGIGLLFYGIFKYKDKWLIIIGSAGILFTVLLYSSLFYLGHNFNKIIDGNKKNNPLIGFTHDNLNNTVKDIEFYKLQYGVYPDSLGAIKGGVAFFDPLQAWGQEKSVNFNYEKIGDRYRLFSSGVDRIPKTKDDLYPTVVSEHTKLGFLAKEEEAEHH